MCVLCALRVASVCVCVFAGCPASVFVFQDGSDLQSGASMCVWGGGVGKGCWAFCLCFCGCGCWCVCVCVRVCVCAWHAS